MAKRGEGRTTSHSQHKLPEVPAGAPPWVTAELLAHTLRVWQPFYEDPLIPTDALEIIMSVAQISEVLATGNGHEAVCRVSSREQP